MIKYNSDQNFLVQDCGLLEALTQKFRCHRSDSKFVSTLLLEILNLFGFSSRLKLLRLKGAHVENLGSRFKPSIGCHTKIWAFSGFLRI
jgi:hypothetical protein